MLSDEPFNQDALMLQGNILHHQEQLEQAEQYYCKAIEADPSKESPFMRLG